MKIFDCCTFFNENDLFRLRFEELKDIVDFFIVVESTHTHSGTRKSIFFDNRWMLDQDRERVIHFIVEDSPLINKNVMANRWLPEHFQRNSIIRPLMELLPLDEDVVLVSDVDEIPRLSSVLKAIEELKKYEVIIFEQLLKKCFVNNKSSLNNNNAPWLGTVASKVKTIKHTLPQALRLGDPISPRAACISWGYGRELYHYELRLPYAGWHFSSMGGVLAHEIKHRSIVEGAQAYDPIAITTIPKSLHNHRNYRSEHPAEINHFLEKHCPELDEVISDDSISLSALNLPRFLIENPRLFERLFYFRDPIFD